MDLIEGRLRNQGKSSNGRKCSCPPTMIQIPNWSILAISAGEMDAPPLEDFITTLTQLATAE